MPNPELPTIDNYVSLPSSTHASMTHESPAQPHIDPALLNQSELGDTLPAAVHHPHMMNFGTKGLPHTRGGGSGGRGGRGAGAARGGLAAGLTTISRMSEVPPSEESMPQPESAGAPSPMQPTVTVQAAQGDHEGGDAEMSATVSNSVHWFHYSNKLL